MQEGCDLRHKQTHRRLRSGWTTHLSGCNEGAQSTRLASVQGNIFIVELTYRIYDLFHISIYLYEFVLKFKKKLLQEKFDTASQAIVDREAKIMVVLTLKVYF